MGDPRRLRNKFSRPKRLWDEERLAEDSALKKEFGLKNASEIWKAADELRKYRREARRLLSISEEDRKEDAEKILNKLAKMGVMKTGSGLEDVLVLTVRDILARRLQTVVHKKGLARTMSQSRQLITHGFISVNGRRLNIPSYLVAADEESAVAYSKAIDINAGMLSAEKNKEKIAEKAAAAKAAAEPKEATPAKAG
jgi:small subunit ribosomal protein S4